MKKILVYIDNMKRNGAQRVVSVLVDHLVSCGYQVVLVNDYYPDELSYPVPESVHRYFFLKEKRGFIFSNIYRVMALRRILRTEKPDVSLSFMKRANLRLILAALFTDKKICVSVRNDPVKEYGSGAFTRRLVNLLFGRADGCVLQTLGQHYYFNDRILKKSVVIPNPVSNVFYETPRPEVKNGIIAAGRLAPQKNFRLLIEAFSLIAPQIQDDLFIYGEGELKQELVAYCREKGLEERVSFCGMASDINEKMAGAKLLVLSSDFEGMPNVLLEAMAVGTACVSTDCPCGSAKELLEDREELLAKPGDARELADKMLRIMTDDTFRAEVERALKNSADRYRQDRICKQWSGYREEI